MGLLATLAGWFSARGTSVAWSRPITKAGRPAAGQQVNERLGKVGPDPPRRGRAVQRPEPRRAARVRNLRGRPAAIDALPGVVGIGFMRRVETARTGAVEALLSAATSGREGPARPDPARTAFVFPVSYIWPQSPRTLVSIGYDGYGDAPAARRWTRPCARTGMAMTGPSGSRRGCRCAHPRRPAVPQGAAGRRRRGGGTPRHGGVGPASGAVRCPEPRCHPGYGLRVDDVSSGLARAALRHRRCPGRRRRGLHREWRFGGRVWALSIYPPPPSGQLAASTPGRRAVVWSRRSLLAPLLGNLSGQQKRAGGSPGDDRRPAAQREALRAGGVGHG